MEIIMLGFILFVIGVGATIVYDKYKDRLKDLSKIKESFGRKETLIQNEFAKIKASLTQRTTTPKKKSQEEIVNELLRERAIRKANPGPFTQSSMEEEFLTKFNEHMAKVQRPGAYNSIKAGPVKESDIPTETYHRELFNDVSINSTLTVQELIAKIEQMKKKL